MEIKDIAAIFKSPIEKLLDLIGSEFQQTFKNQLLEYQVEEYKRNFYAKTLLHRAEPKPLSEFYQPLYLHHSRNKDKVATASASLLFNWIPRMTIIGSAGSGKSTIVKYLFVNCFNERYKIPIKMELRYLNEYEGRFNDYIFNEIFKFQKLGFTDDIIDRLLCSNNFIFFFDGYDEINSNIKSKVTKDMDAFVTKYSGNRYVLTSRPYSNIELLPGFHNFYVCDLEEGEINEFVRKQMPGELEALTNKMIEAIGKAENMSYRSFLSNPLLLSMFILTFQSYAEIPQHRSEFYNQVFETLFSVHDSMSKLAYLREKRSGISKDQFEEILRLFSFISFFEEKFIFTPNYLSDKLDIIKTKKKNLTFDNDLFIEDLQVAIGILNKEGLDYTFPHRSLQEYFSAAYIEKLNVDNKERIYSKLLHEITVRIAFINDKDHFLNLLYEMDYYYLLKFLCLPLIRTYHSEIKYVDVITRKLAYGYYGRLLLTLRLISRRNGDHYNLLLPDLFYRIHENNGKLMLPDDHKIPHDQLDKMVEKVTYFQLSGATIIAQMEASLKALDKSDKDIIDLI